MGAMMEGLGPVFINHLSSKPPPKGAQIADAVFRQMRRDFFVASPFVLHASVPELLAGAWALVRETLFTGDAPRGSKEIVAWAVSGANQCPFCVGAHNAAVAAANVEDPARQDWAAATSTAGDARLFPTPFQTHIEEYFGMVVAFHYLNRMVSVFLDDKMMPTPDVMNGMSNAMAKIMMGGMIKKGERNAPGAALEVLPTFDESLAWRPKWAQGNPAIASAIAGWSALVEGAARTYLDGVVLDALSGVVSGWMGGEVTPDVEWIASVRPAVPAAHREAIELAMLTVMAPFAVDDDRVTRVLDSGYSSEQALVLVAWAAQRAARRVAEWTARPSEVAPAG